MLRKFGLIAALLLPMAVYAEGVSYNYGELNYLYTHGKASNGGGSDDKSTFGLKGSFGFTDMLYGTATYEDKGYGGASKDTFNIGIGAHSSEFTGGFDVLGELTYESLKGNAPGSNKEDGFGLLAGLRGELSPGLEGNAGIKYRKLDDFDGWDFSVGGVYTVAPGWGVSASFTTGKLKGDSGLADIKNNDVRVGLRYMF